MSIAKSLRENAALVAGILLPALVVVLFLLSSWVPRILVDPPQYDFLFAQDSSYYGSPSPWRHQITLDPQGHLLVKAFTAKPDVYTPGDRLYLFEHADGNVREIPLPTPESTEGAENGIVVEVPELRGQFIDPSRISPDGYSLVDNTRSSRGVFGLFYSGNPRPLAISKNGAVFEAAADGDAMAMGWYGARLIGWIVPVPER
jgi:hypothetical protein